MNRRGGQAPASARAGRGSFGSFQVFQAVRLPEEYFFSDLFDRIKLRAL
jgi:hypothetical protein